MVNGCARTVARNVAGGLTLLWLVQAGPAAAQTVDCVADSEHENIRDELSELLGRRLQHELLRFNQIPTGEELGDWLHSQIEIGGLAIPVVRTPSGSCQRAPWSDDAPWDACMVVVPREIEFADDAREESLLAHEIYHCFQMEALGPGTYNTHMPPWLKEGAANWAGETVAGGSPNSEFWWSRYFTEDLPLFERNYDAIGFFSHLDHSLRLGRAAGLVPEGNGGLWSEGVPGAPLNSLWRMLDATYFALKMGADPILLPALLVNMVEGNGGLRTNDTLPMGLARVQGPTSLWDMSGPGITNHRRPYLELGLGVGHPIDLNIDSGRQVLFRVSIPPQAVVSVALSGSGGINLGDLGNGETELIRGSYLHRLCSTCSCPAGMHPPPGVQLIEANTLVVALTRFPFPEVLEARARLAVEGPLSCFQDR